MRRRQQDNWLPPAPLSTNSHPHGDTIPAVNSRLVGTSANDAVSNPSLIHKDSTNSSLTLGNVALTAQLKLNRKNLLKSQKETAE